MKAAQSPPKNPIIGRYRPGIPVLDAAGKPAFPTAMTKGVWARVSLTPANQYRNILQNFLLRQKLRCELWVFGAVHISESSLDGPGTSLSIVDGILCLAQLLFDFCQDAGVLAEFDFYRAQRFP